MSTEQREYPPIAQVGVAAVQEPVRPKEGSTMEVQDGEVLGVAAGSGVPTPATPADIDPKPGTFELLQGMFGGPIPPPQG